MYMHSINTQMRRDRHTYIFIFLGTAKLFWEV